MSALLRGNALRTIANRLKRRNKHVIRLNRQRNVSLRRRRMPNLS
jgi:hypothetical protein